MDVPQGMTKKRWAKRNRRLLKVSASAIHPDLGRSTSYIVPPNRHGIIGIHSTGPGRGFNREDLDRLSGLIDHSHSHEPITHVDEFEVELIGI